ncbi:MAG TPA: sulfatase-like hydrolase/transferase [Arachnia sp.]|nr:sulfatase-like hydrolase/transferase [Arachnia sp.]HMT86380.1 sulfatase-like hydrolase/transferase [Arachnia sp.]
MISVRALVSRLADPPHRLVHFVIAAVPVALLGVHVKIVRSIVYYPAAGLLDRLAQISSDIAFGAAWVIGFFLFLASGRRLRTTRFYLALAWTLLIGVFTVVNHAFMMRTGNAPAWHNVVTLLNDLESLGGMFGAQVDRATVSLMSAVLIWVLIAPWVLSPVVDAIRCWARRSTTSRHMRLSRRVALGGVAATLALVLASLWTAPTASAMFSLAPPVQLAMTPIRKATAFPEELESAEVVIPDPANTRVIPRDDAPRRNLVIITLESTRDSSTLPADVRRSVTPVLDDLKEQSLAPERGYTVLPHTTKALIGTTCGQTPPLDYENSEAEANGLYARCLPDLLGAHGYRSAFFQSATEHFERRRAVVANMGYDEFHPVDQLPKEDFHKANYFGYEDDIMLQPEREWIEENRDQPFVLGMLTVTAHHDYDMHGYPQLDFVDNRMFNNYLNGVHYQDAFVGKVIDMFKELGLYENTIFVIAGDHGEGFGEHRVYQHDNTIYEEGARIPMLIHDPQHGPQRVDGPASQLSLAPTALDLLGFDLVSSDLDYLPSWLSTQPQPPVTVTCLAAVKCAAVIDGDIKVIHHFGDRRDEVFDLAEDNYEQTDLAGDLDEDWVAERTDIALEWWLSTDAVYQAYREAHPHDEQ